MLELVVRVEMAVLDLITVQISFVLEAVVVVVATVEMAVRVAVAQAGLIFQPLL
jgi:hypothetical protein